jgi:DNA-binding transcriptional LysR family regulator
MKLRPLRFVQAVAQCRSISRAAELCHATQPTLSNAISNLEEELGGRLFERTTRKVELTQFGRHMLPHIDTVLASCGELEAVAAAYHNPVHKLLRIGFSPLVDFRLLDRVLEPFRNHHPDVSLFFKECLLGDLSQRLSDGTIDLAVVPQSLHDAQHDGVAFYSDALIYLPCDNAADTPPPGPLRLSNLPDTPVVLTGGGCGLTEGLEPLFEQQGRALRAYPGQAITYRVIEEWASLGIGAGILPAAKLSAAAAGPRPLLLNDGSQAAFTFDWIWPSGATHQAHGADLIDWIRTRVPALVRGDTARHASAPAP